MRIHLRLIDVLLLYVRYLRDDSCEETAIFTSDPSTIFPITPPPPTGPTAKSQCMKGGWMTFTDPEFKNQGQCVAHVIRANRMMR